MKPPSFYGGPLRHAGVSVANAGGITAPLANAAKTPAVFQKYCLECHGLTKPEADLSIQLLLAQPSVGPQAEHWEKVLEMLETVEMPPKEATLFPTVQERAAAVAWVRSS